MKAIRPLHGVRVLEFAGLAPVPMVGLMLQDHGADVIRIDQFSALFPDLLGRGKKSISLNLKQPNQELQSAAHGILHKLVANSDVLLDPFRPGTLEGLGWSPTKLHEVNAQLVVARLTGYGGCAYGNAYTKAAGHDINYVAMSGMLSLMRRGSEKPQAPLNLLGDFAGGSSMAFSGILLALLERAKSKKGKIVDISMVAGTRYLGSLISNLAANDLWKVTPFLKPGGAPYYDAYATSDGRFLAIGAIEPQFYKAFVKGAASMCTSAELASAKEALLQCKQHDSSSWHTLTSAIERIIASGTLAQWTDVFGPSGPYADACVTPVLSQPEAATFAREGKVVLDSALETISDSPEAAPRLHDVAGQGEYPIPSAKECIVEPGAHTNEVLTSLGYSGQQVKDLLSNKVVMQADSAQSLDARM